MFGMIEYLRENYDCGWHYSTGLWINIGGTCRMIHAEKSKTLWVYIEVRIYTSNA